MNRFVWATAILLVAAAIPAEAQRRCTKGIPCGNTCISATKTCRVGSGSATKAGSTRPDSVAPRPSPTATNLTQKQLDDSVARLLYGRPHPSNDTLFVGS